MEDANEQWGIFGDSPGHGRPASIAEVLKMIQHFVEDHDMPTEDALAILIDIVRPGGSDNSHDVRPMFVGAMWATGFGYLCDKVESLFINSMPWGVAFSIAVEKDFEFRHLSKVEQKGVINALCTVLLAGGLNARVDEDNHIILTADDGEESTMDIEATVAEFVEEMEAELGPPRPEDPMQRWTP